MFVETFKRTFARTFIWRIFAYCGTSIIIYFVTNDIKKSFSFGLIDHSIKFVFQYAYERIWNRLDWGKEERFKEVEEFANI